MVKQTADVLRPLNGSGQVNVTLVDVVMRSILPRSHHPLFAQEVADLFVASTGMDRFGSTSLYSLRLQPHEAIVIKLFEAQNYS